LGSIHEATVDDPVMSSYHRNQKAKPKDESDDDQQSDFDDDRIFMGVGSHVRENNPSQSASSRKTTKSRKSPITDLEDDRSNKSRSGSHVRENSPSQSAIS
jgi:hypothetical protein